MKAIYICLFILISLSITAQPAITSAWAPSSTYANRINMKYNTHSMNAGASGTNVTWNLTSFTSTTPFINADSGRALIVLSGSSSFPTTTDMLERIEGGVSTYYFRELQGSVYKNLGYNKPGTSSDNDFKLYDPSLDLIRFPVTYNSLFQTSSYYNHVYTYNSTTTSTHGATTAYVQADGYGRLNTPAGGFVNVMRIHTIESTTDSLLVSFQNYNIQSISVERYDWIAADRPGIILASIQTTTNVNGSFYYNYYAQVAPTAPAAGIESLSENEMELYPQPAADRITIVVPDGEKGVASICLYDITGRGVVQQSHTLDGSNHNIDIDISTVANGIYTLVLQTNEAISTHKLIVSH